MKRIHKIMLGVLLLPIGAIILYICVIFPVMRENWESKTKIESIRILEDVAPDIERAHIEEPSPVSLLLSYPDNSWMAFIYKDRHYFGIYSSTIVRDSGGQWFESNRHFCGMLSAYRSHYEMQVAARDNAMPDAVPPYSLSEELDAVAFAPSLQTGREKLFKMGFRPMKK